MFIIELLSWDLNYLQCPPTNWNANSGTLIQKTLFLILSHNISSNVDFDEESGGPVVGIADYDEFDGPNSISNIPAEELKAALGLGLEAGRLDGSGNFVELEENAKLVIGSPVYIELQKNLGITNFK